MNSEELLKSISGILNKHKDFLNSNPEIFYTIEDRLYKAVGEDDEEEGYADNYGEDEYSDMFDEQEGDEDGYDQSAQQQDINAEEEEWSPESGDEEVPVDKIPEKTKGKSSGGRFREWAPKDEYHPDHQDGIDKLMEEGWSHREAERIVGAHDTSSNPSYSTIHGSEPSKKMLSQAQKQAFNFLKEHERKLSSDADARKNPILAGNAINRKAHNEAHESFDEAYNNFLNSDEIKGLKHRAKHKAKQEFEKQWHEDNPDHKDNATNVAATSSSFSDAKAERQDHLNEGEKDIAESNMTYTGDASTMGEFSENAAGGGDTTTQGKMQAVGGVQNESGGYSAGTIKSPALHVAEQYPEYADHVREKQKAKLAEVMNSPQFKEQKQRYSAQKSLKKEGDE